MSALITIIDQQRGHFVHNINYKYVLYIIYTRSDTAILSRFPIYMLLY